jgi:hypothetical protein
MLHQPVFVSVLYLHKSAAVVAYNFSTASHALSSSQVVHMKSSRNALTPCPCDSCEASGGKLHTVWTIRRHMKRQEALRFEETASQDLRRKVPSGDESESQAAKVISDEMMQVNSQRAELVSSRPSSLDS